nr:hypothetical protein [Tanacetum cinerariifolium]
MESVSKQGRKSDKPRPKLDDSARLDVDGMEYMETEEAMDEGRTSNKTEEFNLDVDTKVTTKTREVMKEEKAKEKGVEFKEVEESDRPARLVLTLKPLPTVDPKDKGKAILEEPKPKKMTRSDFDGAQVVRDEEIARQLEAELHKEVEKER